MPHATGMTSRTHVAATLIACLTGGVLVGGIAVAVAPARAATTGAGISDITPYGGYLGNYIAPDGTRVYCIDPLRDWPSDITGDGVVISTLITERGVELDSEVLRDFDLVLSRYGQTEDPVLAAAVSAFLYGYTSGFAQTHGPGFGAAMHFINGEPEVEQAFAMIWSDVEGGSAPATPIAELSIEMSDPVAGVVRVDATPADAAGTLSLEGAVVTGTGESTVAVDGSDSIAITATPSAAVETYTIAATASFEIDAGPQPRVTLYETGSQQRTIRDSGPALVEFGTSAKVEVARPAPPPETPAPTLAATGSPVTSIVSPGMLAGAVLVGAGILVPLVGRRRPARGPREYRSAAAVIPPRE